MLHHEGPVDATRRGGPGGEEWGSGEGVIQRLEDAWKGGGGPAAADFLPEGAPHALLVELVHSELEFRLKAGEPARVESYLSRFPALAQDRPALLDLLVAE